MIKPQKLIKNKIEASFTEEDEPFVMEVEAGNLDSFQECEPEEESDIVTFKSASKERKSSNNNASAINTESEDSQSSSDESEGEISDLDETSKTENE